MWLQPKFNPSIQIIITVLVVGVSGPINVLISIAVYYVLLTPSKSETRETERLISTRRGSVAQALQHTPPKVVPSTSGRVQRQKSLLVVVADVDESLAEYYADDHKLRTSYTDKDIYQDDGIVQLRPASSTNAASSVGFDEQSIASKPDYSDADNLIIVSRIAPKL